MTISILDYGLGNAGSISNMFRKIGASAAMAATPAELGSASKILLPGVGSFDAGIRALEARGLVEPLLERARAGIPILGICLGMQLLARASDEGALPGLGLFDARCQRFQMPAASALKVPHMGWALLARQRDSRLLRGLDESARFYFVHSYHVVCADRQDVVATSDYGGAFVSMIERGNVMGAQFHPEKSHRFGMQLLRNFAEI
jgi:glutamine amidotransferase